MLIYTFLVAVLGLAVAGSTAYLFLLFLAASRAVRKSRVESPAPQRENLDAASRSLPIAVVIPAHNESLVLAATLDSLKAQDYPESLMEIVVVADNCTDTTAEIARNYGVTVLERFNTEERGKGYALDWAFTQLLARPEPAEAFVIVDADTWVAPDFLRLMAARLQADRDAHGCCALQGRYGVLNRQDGWRAALMAGAFDLYNHVKPLGYDRLGLSVNLKGNGMAFTREVLQRAQWQGQSVTEDIDYGLDLIRHHGIRVGYVAEARVLAQMPVTAAQAASQRERWEGGRYRLLRARALPLLTEGLRRRDIRLCDAAVGLMVPPLAELAALLFFWGSLIAIGQSAHLLFGSVGWWALWALSALGFLAYILGGLRVAGAPREVYAALLKAPFYALWKFALYAVRFIPHPTKTRSSQPEWVRTERIPVLTSPLSESTAEVSPPENRVS